MKTNRKILIGSLAVVAIAIAFYVSLTPGSHKSNDAQSKVGESEFKLAPSFELQDSKGAHHKLEELKGNIVIVHFWASWCPPCLSEIPTWVELANRYKNQPIKLVAISLDESWEEAEKILPSKGLPSNLLSLLDSKASVPDLFGTYQYPETYILSKDQRILVKLIGPQDWQGERIGKLLDEIMKRSAT